jgi:hypothetical protein
MTTLAHATITVRRTWFVDPVIAFLLSSLRVKIGEHHARRLPLTHSSAGICLPSVSSRRC